MRVDTSLPVALLPSPNISGTGYSKTFLCIHSIECPPGTSWAESLGGPAYMQNPASKVSVAYIVDADSIAQTAQEDAWTWSAGPYANRRGLHIEQAGYASFTRAQWLGLTEAIGTTYQRPNGSTVTYTAQDAADMASQLRLLALLVADIAKRHGWALRHLTADQLRAASAGTDIGGGVVEHRDVSQILGGTSHTDAGDGYPLDELLAAAIAINHPAPIPPQEDQMTPDQEAKLDKAVALATRAARDAAVVRAHVARVFVQGQSTFAGSVAAASKAIASATGAKVGIV